MEQFEVQRQSVRLVRPVKFNPQPVSALRGTIDSFSAKSQRRLRLAASNADPQLISMFVATYAENWPKDGKESKAQLDLLLHRLRRRLPKVAYLWVLEFQGRGAPHYHLFLSVPVTPALHSFLADAWTDIAAPGCAAHSRVHRHAKAFITWDMGSGAYVAKYLDKANQKDVPEGYENVGRFWGASRGLVPKPNRIQADEMDVALFAQAPKAVKQAVRWLCKWHERHTSRKTFKKMSWLNHSVPVWEGKGFSWARKSSMSYMIPTGAAAFRQICSYLMVQPVQVAASWWDDISAQGKGGNHACA